MTTLIDIFDTLKADAETDLARSKRFAEEHLPVIADMVTALASNPLVQVALNVVHLSPDFLTQLASVIQEADTKLGVAKQAQADADAAQAAALAAAAAG